MNRGADNYYLILELDFLKPEEDLNTIRDRIKQKGSYWNANCEKGPKEQQARFRKYKNQLMQIQKVMTEPSERKKEAAEAASYVKEKLNEELKFFAGQKQIGEKEASAIMKRCGLWNEMFEQMSGMKIITEKEKGENPNPEPPKKNRFTASVAALKLLGKKDLYDFLRVREGDDWYDLKQKDNAELLRIADGIWESVKYQPPSDEQTQTGTLYALCQEVFDPADTELRGYYDQFISWQQRSAVITRMTQYAGDGKFLNAHMYGLFVDELTRLEGDRKLAEDKFRAICDFYELHYEGTGQGSGSASAEGKFVDCGHCFTRVDVSHGERKCPECGRDLYVSCPNPKCKKEIPASSRACRFCGCKLENLGRTQALLTNAQAAIDRMDFAAAAQYLAQAEKLLPGYDKTGRLKNVLDGMEKALSAQVSGIEQLADKKAYRQAAALLDDLYRKNPGAKLDKEKLIRTSLKEAEDLFAQALAAKEESRAISLCDRILRICSDYPVETLITRYPPKPVSQLEAKSDPGGGNIILTWQASPSEGEVSYRIVRKKGTASAEIRDGEQLGTAGTTRFVDEGPQPGVEYFYTVYTVRAGVASQGAFVSCVNLKEIVLTGTDVGNGFVRIGWQPVCGSARVRISRKEGLAPASYEDGKQIEPGSSYLMDTQVQNDHTYGYRVGIVYSVNGRLLETPGVTILGTPGAMPEPVLDLTVVCLEEEVFEARWTPQGEEKVSFFYTEKHSREQAGEAVSLGTLQKEYESAVILKAEPGVCRLRIPALKKFYVIPVSVKGQTGIMGEPAAAVVMERIRVETVEPVNGRLQIEFIWPRDAVSVLILSHPAKYIADPGERAGAAAVSMTKKQYDAHRYAAIPQLEAREYYLSFFACCRTGGELMYSQPTHAYYNNMPKADIEYAVSVTGLFRNKKAVIRFSSTAQEFELPEINIVSKRDGQPVYASSGTLLVHIDRRKVQGSYEVELPLASLPSRTYIKAFFADESLYDQIQLRMAYGSQAKLN